MNKKKSNFVSNSHFQNKRKLIKNNLPNLQEPPGFITAAPWLILLQIVKQRNGIKITFHFRFLSFFFLLPYVRYL